MTVGTKWLDEGEFVRRLGYLYREGKKVSILAGSGFSKSAGVPLTREIVPALGRVHLRDEYPTSEELTKICLDCIYGTHVSDVDLWPALDAKFPGRKLLSNEAGRFQELTSQFWSHPQRCGFFDRLISIAEDLYGAGNLETYYLAHLCGIRNEVGQRFISSVLTTNFDNVIPSCFYRLGQPIRILDFEDSLYSLADATSAYTPVLYLHGRTVNYNLVVAETDIEAIAAGVKSAAASPGSSSGSDRIREDELRRANFIYQHLSEAASGALVICGYSGWEDAIMAALELLLREGGKFAEGLIWCQFSSDRSKPDDGLVRLSRKQSISALSDVSALGLMHLLQKAIGLPEHLALQACEARLDDEALRLKSHWYMAREHKLAWCAKDQRPPVLKPRSFPPGLRSAIVHATNSSELNHLRHDLLDLELRNPAVADLERAEMLFARGQLRARYSIGKDGAFADLHCALSISRAGGSKELEAKAIHELGMLYAHVGKLEEAQKTISEFEVSRWPTELKDYVGAYTAAVRSQMFHLAGSDSESLASALSGLPQAEAAGQLELASLLALRAASSYRALLDRAGAARLVALARKYAREDGSNYAAGRAQLNSGVAHFDRGDFGKAQSALQRAIDYSDFGPDLPLRAQACSFLGDAYLASRDLESASKLYRQAIELDELTLGKYVAVQAEICDVHVGFLASTARSPNRKELRERLGTAIDRLAIWNDAGLTLESLTYSAALLVSCGEKPGSSAVTKVRKDLASLAGHGADDDWARLKSQYVQRMGEFFLSLGTDSSKRQLDKLVTAASELTPRLRQELRSDGFLRSAAVVVDFAQVNSSQHRVRGVPRVRLGSPMRLSRRGVQERLEREGFWWLCRTLQFI